MSVIRVGSSGTYASGWDAIFGGGTAKAKKSSAKARKAAKPKTAKPKAAKRSKKASKRR